MPLVDWQAALGTLVATRAAGGNKAVEESFAPLQLAPDEQVWLASLPASAGFHVTCAIQRWWRETRLRSLARLTIAALGPQLAAQMMSDYLHVNLCSSLFFLPETLAFLQFVADRTTQPHPRAIAQFERALLIAREAAEQETGQAETALYIEFAAPPEAVLAALLSGQVLPEPRAERFGVYVSPTLPSGWRVASEQEATAHFKRTIPARV